MDNDIEFLDGSFSHNKPVKESRDRFAISQELERPDIPYPVDSMFEGPRPPVGVSIIQSPYTPQFNPQFNPQSIPQNKNYLGLNCIDVANHLQACPVCSKLHKSNAHIFLGIIVALIIIIVFLSRKFFD